MSIHQSIASSRKALHYHDTVEGCCHGLAVRWIEACMLNEEQVFDTRIRKIDSYGESLADRINGVKQKVRDKIELTQEDLYLLDILAFYDSFELYHAPKKFPAIFNNEYHSHHDIDATSIIAASDAMGELGNLATIYSEPGIYTVNEISAYLDELARAMQSAGSMQDDRVGILLGSMNHTMGLTYQPQVGWRFMDINQYPSEYSPETFDPAEDIAKKIWAGFKAGNPNASPYVTFNTSIIVTGNQARQNPRLKEELEIVKKSHVLTNDIAQREDTINLAWIAAKHDHANLISLLTEAHADLDITDIHGATPACVAAQNGYVHVIALLGEAGADLGKADVDGLTPAYVAAENGHADVIALLGEAGADLDKANVDGVTPAYIAAQNGHADVIAALSKARANLDGRIRSGATPACVAAQAGHAHVIAALGEARADLDRAMNDGRTPAFIAALKGHADVIAVLGEAGADLDRAIGDGVTPAYIAAQNGHAGVITVLGKAGADLGRSRGDGVTPAYIAAQNGHARVIAELLKHKATMDIPSINTAINFYDLVSGDDGLTKSRMEIIIQRQLNAGEKAEAISIKPYDIAWIMGHEDIVAQLQEVLGVSSFGMFAHVDAKPATIQTEDKGAGYTPGKL